jgi:hypothetical protein
MQVELVDRHGRVVHQMPFDDSVFPLTVRIAQSVAEPVAAPAPVTAGWSDRGRALLAAAMTSAIFGGIVWIRTLSRSPGASAIGGAIGLMILVAMYAGVWALGSRIAKHHARFARHFTWACGCALALTLIGFVSDVALFFVPSAAMYVPLTLLWVVLGGVAIAGQLGIASSMPLARRWRVAGVVVASVLGLSALGAYSDWNDFNTKVSYVGSVQPFSARVIPAESPNDFAKSLDDVKTQLDKAAAKR